MHDSVSAVFPVRQFYSDPSNNLNILHFETIISSKLKVKTNKQPNGRWGTSYDLIPLLSLIRVTFSVISLIPATTLIIYAHIYWDRLRSNIIVCSKMITPSFHAIMLWLWGYSNCWTKSSLRELITYSNNMVEWPCYHVIKCFFSSQKRVCEKRKPCLELRILHHIWN
jgi:hypothetical protein